MDITREDADDFGLRSQVMGAKAWDEDAFATQIVPVTVPVLDDEGKETGDTITVTRTVGYYETTLERGWPDLPVAREDGVHTAGSSSQVSDGAGALMMTREKADALGLTPLAEIVDVNLVGVDPVTMLEGPIDSTKKLLEDNDLSVDDIDVFEINEAFASVVLAWAKELGLDMAKVNPNGARLRSVTHRRDRDHLADQGGARTPTQRRRVRIVSMCCGGGVGTGTLSNGCDQPKLVEPGGVNSTQVDQA